MHRQSTMRAIEAADGTRNYHRALQQLSELPSPQSALHSATLPDTPLWTARNVPPVPPLKPSSPVPPRELEGDTYIHEHHPAINTNGHAGENDSEGFKEANEVSPQTPFNGDAFSGSALGAGGVDEDEEFGVESPVLGRNSTGKD